jgi:hypothetical protein
VSIIRFKKEKRDFKWKIRLKIKLFLVWAKLFSFAGNKMKHCFEIRQ